MPPGEFALFVSLQASREAGAQMPTIHRGASRAPVALSFFAPAARQGESPYSAELQAAGGEVIMAITRVDGCNAVGTCTLIVAPDVLREGTYRLRLRDPDGKIRAEFPFRVAP